MIHAYSEIYLDDAMNTLAEVFSYTPDARQADVLFQRFVMSGIAYQFGKGNPRYLNMPSQALFYEIVGDSMPLIYPRGMGRSPQYWCGYVLAYYQWYTGLSFMEIGKFLPPSKIISMYNPLHEAPIEKFVEIANSIVLRKETRLAMYRKNAKLSQNDLARLSGVSLRSIQLYEQRKLDINYANAIRLYKLSKILGCNMEDLIERGHW
jgi:DNA-binding XRE family transcriptional regulator